MADLLRHRGPDDEGYVLICTSDGDAEERRGDDTVAESAAGLRHVVDAAGMPFDMGLAHRRLSIIDTSSAGHQPMSSTDGMLWLTYNGEIYNYVELRGELEGLGYEFRGNSDTEVLLAAYEQWGEACLSRLDGMWAFALADLRRRRLFCARDRLGVKPFYYALDGQRFAFASEIKALLPLPFVVRAANDPMVWDFLVLGALDHTNETLFAGVHALAAGSYLLLSFDGDIKQNAYWTIDNSLVSADAERPVTDADVHQVRDLVTEAVRRRLRSDVEIGFCLSGGLDSSTIVGMAGRLVAAEHLPQVGERLKAFHAHFDDPAIDELRYAQAAIELNRLTPFFVSPTASEFLNDYERLLAQQDEPFGGPSVYAQYRVVRMAHEAGVKVLLDGQGADELFGGYYAYHGIHTLNALASGRASEALATLHLNGSRIARHASLQLALRRMPMKLARGALLKSRSDLNLVQHSFLAAHRERSQIFLEDVRAADTLSRTLALDLTRHSLPHLLRYEDRNSMAFSLEARVPFADDPRLVAYVCGLPESAKIRRGWSKYILRQATAGIVPDQVRWRRRKLGFAAPESRWAAELWSGSLRDLLAECDGAYVNQPYVRKHLQASHLRVVAPFMLWRLAELTLWERGLKRIVPFPAGQVRSELCLAGTA